ncbi:hypothetical protein KQ313_01430 [Synechococcus sp. CS-1325]|uniref:hypothetical protein n=1 Tax=Synechococcus sp. CS-1325 TaxID=2847979 RepID=UPI000DB3D51F|nr:hypothetical protein [Synechococcus sp. CS-1325]MCT0198350.1 hypothetical protein [Synechococcus sp. CS-1325]PZV00223.1 MAG: hypothetical protein DCF24_07715 [Cyanobium sp.]
MRAPSETELLALWESGQVRHPIDRMLLLCAWARPQRQLGPLADLPLGSINIELLRLRAACFGPRIDAYTDCQACGERLTLLLDVDQLLAGVGKGDGQDWTEIGGLRFRAPTSRDLAAVVDEPDPQAAALRLLESCLIEAEQAPAVADLTPERIGAIEAGLEALDPAADFGLALTCDACAHSWVASLDIGALLWEEISDRVHAVLLEIHELAHAYGWSEPEILALSPKRRAVYLGLVRI